MIHDFQIPTSTLLPMCLLGSTQDYQIAVMISHCTNGAHFLWMKCAYARFESASLQNSQCYCKKLGLSHRYKQVNSWGLQLHFFWMKILPNTSKLFYRQWKSRADYKFLWSFLAIYKHFCQSLMSASGLQRIGSMWLSQSWSLQRSCAAKFKK